MAAISDKRVSGHPAGLAVLSATELAERFSYYGMTALLTLYMVKQLLLPGHAEHVIGLATIRDVFEFRGPMSNQAFASLLYGWYGGLVYLTPIVGGWIADRWLGARRTVIAGALLMAAGHLAMSFNETFLIALTLLICGSGCLKGNISAQVGTLYPPGAESERARGFTIFSTGINIGSVAGPLATGAVAQAWGWHAGFALAAVLMLAALGTYLAGQRLLPEAGPRRRDDAVAALPLTTSERRHVGALAIVALLVVPIGISYSMIWNVGILWVDQRVSLASPLGSVPASWFNAIDSFASIVAAAPLIALWAWQSRRGVEPGSVGKIGIGALITGASALLFVAGSLAAGPGGQVPVLWAMAGYFGMGVGFMWYWPVTLALFAQYAPDKLRSTLMGCAFLSLFAATTIMGWVGSYYETMSEVRFWTLDAAIAFGGALAVFALKRRLSHALQSDHLSSTPK